MPGYTLNEYGDLKYLTFDILARTGMVVHAFTTRQGGVSRGTYKSLNMALHVGDLEGAVLENRRRACAALGAGLEDMVCGQQVHGAHVQVVTWSHRGMGSRDCGGAIPGCDALVTGRPGVLLSSYYADCVPLLILDPVKGAVGLAHAGWKGTVSRIAAVALVTMARSFGSDPGDCLAAIAPSIGPCCYEVDRPVIDALYAGGFDLPTFALPAGPDRWRLDLPGLNRAVLEEAGLRPQSIAVSGLCTMCNPELFFSYRGQSGMCGRMASLITLR